MSSDLLFTRDRAAPFRWNSRSRLIWHPRDVVNHYSTPDQAFCYFRKEIPLSQKPAHAVARLFADSRYRLWVNGRELSRGPVRNDPRWPLVDEVDIAAALQAGPNVIVILVAYFGYRTGQTISRYPALIFEADIDTKTERIVVPTDETWTCLPASEFILGAPRINGCQPRIEVIDTAKKDPRIHLPGFANDQSLAARTRDPAMSPFWHWSLNYLPPLQRGYHPFLESCRHGDFTPGPAGPHPLPAQIIEEQASIVRTRAVQKLPILFKAGDATRGRTAILDGGAMEVGYFQSKVRATEETVVDLLFGEYLVKENVPVDMNANRILERHVIPPGEHLIESMFNWRASRYVQVFVRSRGDVTLLEAGFHTRHYPLVDRAAAQTGDALLDSLWTASVKTLRLCMQDGFLDSSSREQQQWMGDGRLQALYHFHISGDSRLHRRLLECFAQSQDCTGMTTSRYPDDHYNLPPIPSFCLHWISSFGEYHRLTRDSDLARKWWPNLLLGLRWFSAYEDESGLLSNVPGWSFIDWGSRETPRAARDIALNFLYLEALKTMLGLSIALGDDEAQRCFSVRIQRLGADLRAHAWDETAGAYIDYVEDGKKSAAFSETVNTLALLHLHAVPEDPRAKSILDSVFPSDGSTKAVPCSPFFTYFVTKALARHGRHAQANRYFRTHFGPMLRQSDTLWERWEITGDLSSASHAWSASWLAYVVESLAGVELLAPHAGRIRLAPHLGDLDRLRCRVPAGDDAYDIEILREGPSLRLHLTIPPNREIVLGDRTLTAGTYRDLLLPA